MKSLRMYIIIPLVFLLLTSQPYINGYTIGEIKNDYNLKTNGLVILKIGEDPVIEKGVYSVINILNEDKYSSRIVNVDSTEELSSALLRYRLFQVTILVHGSNEGISIDDSLLSWELLARMINNREHITYIMSCYSNSILSYITNQKTKMLTFAPWEGIVDQKIAASSTGALFLTIHGETSKAANILGGILTSHRELISNPIDALGYSIPHNQWVHNVNVFLRSGIETLLSAFMNFILAYAGHPITVVLAIIQLFFLALDSWNTWVFFTDLGIGLGDSVDIYYDYTYVNGLILPFSIFIPFIGDFFLGGLSWDTDTFMEIHHDPSNTIFRVKSNLVLLGFTIGGLITLGVSFLSWSLISTRPISTGSEDSGPIDTGPYH